MGCSRTGCLKQNSPRQAGRRLKMTQEAGARRGRPPQRRGRQGLPKVALELSEGTVLPANF